MLTRLLLRSGGGTLTFRQAVIATVRLRTAQDPGIDVDVIVRAEEGDTVWHLTDLLGRSMGNIVENASHQFAIYPEGAAVETMAGIDQGPHASRDAALAEIERHTRGVCRRSRGEDKP
jgi:hypothetical protein